MKEYPFPWTDSGLELLDRINEVIKENGGREAMHELVTLELNKSVHWRRQRKEQEILRLTVTYGIPLKQACELIPVSYRSFAQKINNYKRLNNIPIK